MTTERLTTSDFIAVSVPTGGQNALPNGGIEVECPPSGTHKSPNPNVVPCRPAKNLSGMRVPNDVCKPRGALDLGRLVGGLVLFMRWNAKARGAQGQLPVGICGEQFSSRVGDRRPFAFDARVAQSESPGGMFTPERLHGLDDPLP